MLGAINQVIFFYFRSYNEITKMIIFTEIIDYISKNKFKKNSSLLYDIYV